MAPQLKRSRDPNAPPAPPPIPSSSAAGKRVKFAPGGDTAAGGDEDDLDGEGEGGRKGKGIMNEGYDSDSSAGSDGGYGIGGGRKGASDAKGARGGGGDDDDDDMFGGDDDEGKGKGKGKEKKNKEFLEMGDIEGQEFGKGEEGEDSEAEEEDYIPEDDLANDDDAPRTARNKEGMGYKLSSFNMKDELDEGRFSADGSYIANDLDPNAAHDSWLGGISKIAMKAAKESKKRMEEADRAREEKETKGDGAMAGERDDCFLGLLEMVREGETVAGALARLGKQKAALSSKVTPSSDSMDLDSAPVPSSTAPTVASISARILRLTHLSSTLLSTHGELEIYDATHASIIALLRSEGAVRRDWIPPVDPSIAEEYLEEAKAKVALASTASSSSGPINRTRALISRPVSTTTNGGGGAGGTFYYKWVVTPAGGEEGKEYGPFGRAEVQGWVGQGYFGSGGEAVVVRKEGGSAWSTWREASA